jgi:hypothetical protein
VLLLEARLEHVVLGRGLVNQEVRAVVVGDPEVVDGTTGPRVSGVHEFESCGRGKNLKNHLGFKQTWKFFLKKPWLQTNGGKIIIKLSDKIVLN